MAVFGPMQLTTQGQALYTKAQTGTTLTFTRMQIGSGELAFSATLSSDLSSGTAYTALPVNALSGAIESGSTITIGSQTVTTSAQAAQGATSISVNSFTPSANVASGTSLTVTPNTASLTALITPVAYFNINSESASGNTASIKGIFENTNLTSSTYVCEIGLFAQDPTAGEILYSYANAGTQGDTLPPYANGPISRQFNISVALGNATNVTVNIPDNTYIPTTQLGVANGVATLDNTGKVPSSQIPSLNYIPTSAEGAPSGVATLDSNGNVPASQLRNAPTPANASTTQAGIVELNSSVTSTDETTAATPKAVKTVNDSLATHTADYVKHPGYATTTGTANTYAVTLNPAPTAYVDGMGIVAKINVASTGASTLNVNGLGAKSIKDSLGNDITSGGLKANTPYTLRYEATSGNFIVQGKGGGGNAGSGDLLVGKTATVDSGQITGTMPNNGTFNLGLGVAVPAGYYSGGTTANGKRWASGTVTSTSTYPSFTFASGGTGTSYEVVVSGLTFKPSLILLLVTVGSVEYITVYSELSAQIYPKEARTFSANGTSGSYTSVNFKGDVSPANVSSSGFTLPVNSASAVYSWIAYE